MMFVCRPGAYIKKEDSATGTHIRISQGLNFPALVGLGVISILSWRTTGKPGKWGAIILAVLCWAAALYSIPLGIAGLLSNFGMVGVTFVIGG